MKKLFAISLIGVAAAFSGTASAAVATACGGGNATKVDVFGGPGAVVASPNFVKTGFSVQCSSNVYLEYNEVSGTLFVVGAASKKGNQYVGGSSAGGAVKVYNKCAADPCTATDAQSGVTSATTDASSG